MCKDSGADVSLDGSSLFAAPGTVRRLVLPGEHSLVAQKSARLSTTKTITLEAGKPATIELVVPTLERRWNRRLPWIVAAGGAAVAVAGVPFYLQARSTASEFQDEVNALCNDDACADGLPESARDLESRSSRYNTLAVIGFTVGGAAIATGVVMALFNQPRVVHPDVGSGEFAVTPVVTRDGAGVSAGWSF